VVGTSARQYRRGLVQPRLVETSIGIAAFDSKKVSEKALMMRKAVRGEPFHGIGMGSADSLSGVEVVIEDEKSHRLIAVYPYRDSDDSKITDSTTDISS
jgi:DNA/RNA-binding domain of Phe-tRNA-synthetase-like protein